MIATIIMVDTVVHVRTLIHLVLADKADVLGGRELRHDDDLVSESQTLTQAADDSELMRHRQCDQSHVV